MSMVINQEKRELVFIVPNSEAPMEAQHKGIANRTVGSFYMSDRYDDCYDFLNAFEGFFYIDIGQSISNAICFLEKIKNKGLANAFKNTLRPQFDAVDALKWYREQEKCNYYAIACPTVNEQKKYLKFDNGDQVYKLFKTFLLGDLTKLIIKKIGDNGFMIYVDECDDFDSKIDNGVVSKWRKADKSEQDKSSNE